MPEALSSYAQIVSILGCQITIQTCSFPALLKGQQHRRKTVHPQKPE